MTRICAIVLFALCLASAVLADPLSGFDEGLRKYRANDMDGAIAAWDQVLSQGYTSGSLLYNLGNAYYRTGKIGRAILCYERARKFLPRDHDLSANLDLARLGTVDKIEQPVRLVIWNWVDGVRDDFSLPELALMFYIFGILGGGAVLVWKFGGLKLQGLFKRLSVAFLILYIGLGCWYFWKVSLSREPIGIVMATKSDVFSAPDNTAKQLFTLHEGTKIRLGENLSGFISVRLADGRKGWILMQEIEKI
jgi:tetratricopeptide (TPR) repeat protein